MGGDGGLSQTLWGKGYELGGLRGVWYMDFEPLFFETNTSMGLDDSEHILDTRK